MRFDTEPGGGLGLALEGGHSARRIVHAGGAQTGRAITGRLAELVAAQPRVEVLEETSAVALWSDGSRCCGVVTDAGAVAARATVLATGGGAALWQRTTNPWGAIGAGAVLAHAGGADLADLEFCQFHPTALALPGSEHDGTLLTEALRGEGAELLDASGRRFTDELAPRDQVTEAILDRIEADRADHVRLDLRPLDAERFPNVFAACRAAGLEPEREPVPVAPAAHYLIGGIVCDLDGRTSLPGLFAVGECACSGVHGANRLASNSLTECFVFGARAAAAAASAPPFDASVPLPEWRFEPPMQATREAIWRRAGPRRDAATARAASRRSLPAGPADRPRGPRPARVARAPPAHRPPASRPGARRRPHRDRAQRQGAPRALVVAAPTSGCGSTHGLQSSSVFAWLSELSSWPSAVPIVVSCCDTGLFTADFSSDWKLLAADLRLDFAWPAA